MAGLTKEQVNPFLQAVEQYMIGKEHVSVNIEAHNGRINIKGSEDTLIALNGKIVEPPK